MAKYVTVAKTDDIPNGQGKAFVVGDRVVAVFNANGHFYAIDDCCPHMGASLADGQVEDSIVACPWHAWRFDIRDGTWCDNRRIQIDHFEVRVSGADIQVQVTGSPVPPPPDSERPETT